MEQFILSSEILQVKSEEHQKEFECRVELPCKFFVYGLKTSNQRVKHELRKQQLTVNLIDHFTVTER